MACRKVLKVLSGVTFLWLIILIYMGLHLYQLVEESQKTLQELERIKIEAGILRNENIALRKETNSRKVRAIHDDIEMTFRSDKIANDGRKITIDETKTQKDNVGKSKIREIAARNYDSFVNGRAPSIEYEVTRRRVENYLREMNYFTTAKLQVLRRELGDKFTENKLDQFATDYKQLSTITANEFEKLRDLDGMNDFRRKMERELSHEVQSRFRKLQNPKDCKKSRRLVCTLNKACGFGCQIHHVIYCMIIAYSSNRTMVMNSRGWRYSKKGWEGTFLPVSETCRNVGFGRVYWGMAYNTKALVAHLPVIDSIYPKPLQLPQAVPRDLVDRILKFHERPFVWWVGQVCAYLFRYQPSMKERIELKKKRIGFKSPIVGMHVRRTDKIDIEAAKHGLEEYLKWAKLYYDKLELTMKLDARRVFIATDDRNLLSEASTKYPDFQFITDIEASKLAGLDHRHSEASLYGIISDIELLSQSDYLVCTFSSQVCRVAYEVMNSKHVDASNKVQSLDDVYYYGGQNEHKVKAIIKHKARNGGEVDLEVGDELAIAGNHWDGYSKALSHRTRLEGLFPSFKIEEVINVADFPKYDN